MQASAAACRFNAPGDTQPRLVRAAHEFEAQLMKELMRPLTAMSDEGGDQAGSEGALSDFAGEELGQSLSRGGGFGISESIIHSLSRNGNDRSCDSVEGSGIDMHETALK